MNEKNEVLLFLNTLEVAKGDLSCFYLLFVWIYRFYHSYRSRFFNIFFPSIISRTFCVKFSIAY